MKADSHPYQWQTIALREYRFLEALRRIYGETAQVELFWDPSREFNRVQCDGIITVRGQIAGQTVSVALTDFRLNGGSFGKENTSRLHHFIREIDQHEGSLIFLLNTLGARFTEGRSLFAPVFSIIPDLLQYRKNHLYIAAAMGKCLGLGAIFLSQAHYRLAMGEGSLVNLTGPEVISIFLGQEGKDFERFASAGHQFKTNSLIHEIQPDAEAVYTRARELAVYPHATPVDHAETLLIPDEKKPKYYKSENALVKVLAQLGGHALEIYPQLSSVARTFLVRRGEQTIGVIANPPLHPNNLLTVRAVERSQFAMELFSALKIPVLSCIDAPGGDPRASESDADAIMKMIGLVHTMIEYPYGKMGIITGRLYGGSCMFAFPKIFGAERTIAIEGAKIGIIGDQIVAKVLEGNPRMKQEWAENSKNERADLSDVVTESMLDAVVPLEKVGEEVDRFLIRAEFLAKPLLSTGSAPGLRTSHRPSIEGLDALEHRAGRQPASTRRGE